MKKIFFTISYFILAFAISSVFYALSLDNVYKSEAVLEVQSDHKSNIPMSGALASLRGYSSMSNIAFELHQLNKNISKLLKDKEKK